MVRLVDKLHSAVAREAAYLKYVLLGDEFERYCKLGDAEEENEIFEVSKVRVQRTQSTVCALTMQKDHSSRDTFPV